MEIHGLYHSPLFPLRNAWICFQVHCVEWDILAVPMILSVIGTVGMRILWIFGLFPSHRSLSVPVYFLSCILDRYHFTAGGVLLFRPQESTQDETACIINVLSALGS